MIGFKSEPAIGIKPESLITFNGIRKIGYTKERALRSDVLPYELPLTFSNYHFYEFLLENKVEYRDGKVFWRARDAALDAIICLLFGADVKATIESHKQTVSGRTVVQHSLKIDLRSIPFGYKIRHKEDEFRELTICHPRNQLRLIDLYDKYKELILYYCSVGPFSIRRPVRLSRFVFYRDDIHMARLSAETVGVEEFGREYENVRSFLVYKDYSHIFKFYESDSFHRCEKKYDKLLKLDISKCFDSIYTHSLAWALLGRESVKEHMRESGGTFAGVFDAFMREANYGETHGIVIGPEFSRIFAELILQAVDRAVCRELKDKPLCLNCNTDYEVFRYVDDYFIFYNEERVKVAFVQVLQLKLKEYRLYLNKAKAISYDKPIITNISMAKHRIEKLLDEKLTYEIETSGSESGAATAEAGGEKKKRGRIRIDSRTLITQFKTILKELEVDYTDTLNYTLAIVEGKSAQLSKDYHSIAKVDSSERQLCHAVVAICEFTFFIYSVSPRVNTSIRLCRILRVFISFLKRQGANRDLRHAAFKAMFDNICLLLEKYKGCEHTPVETLYLLIAMSQLGRDYWLDPEALCSYFNIEGKSGGGVRTLSRLNYVSLVVLLFYMKNKRKYDDLRTLVERTIEGRFRQKKTTFRKDTELTLLLLDTLACPFVRLEVKKAIMEIYGISDEPLQKAIIGKRPYWFTKWTRFDFGDELDAKQSLEVY